MTDFQHGTHNSYIRHKCRCEICKAHRSAYRSRIREEQAARGHLRTLTPRASDEITYDSAHERVREVRGAPSTHACVTCGGQAEEWSYRGGCPRERRGPSNKRSRHGTERSSVMAYSPDPNMYDPRCQVCHRTHDRG